MRERKARALSVGREDGRFRTWGVGLLLMLASALFLASCGGAGDEPASGSGEETVPAGEEAESAGQARAASVADILDNPSEFYGNTATVSGLVTEVVGPNAVVIGGGELVNEGLLVVGAQQLDQIVEGVPEGEAFEIQQQDLVQATGNVREFNLNEVEQEVGYELDQGVFGEFEGRPAVVADSFVLTPQAGGTTMMQQGTNVGITEIVDQPAEFYGQNLTVSGAVAEVIDPNTFVIVNEQTAEQEGLYEAEAGALGEQGVLVSTSNGPNLTEQQTVQVTGTLEQFDAATFEQEMGVQYDVNNEFVSAFADGPAIMATQVQPMMQGGGTTSQ
ncbi:hypothetical protein GBA65_07390 [Rubrobacter marinus]|uniref:Uncharacterized protein n=1 Tax=Rubrobacter marinus TaxID=2653852 RepID=A0A6G8PW02_9ACTN|nr:hypothetical protein [Rubrobacter marinus]QIN78376.1 hypothetical protein GBA65_07390 [Rubrobacter marinus]